MSGRGPDPEPREVLVKEEPDGQFAIEPLENAELSRGEWMEQMPKGDQYRSEWWTLGALR